MTRRGFGVALQALAGCLLLAGASGRRRDLAAGELADLFYYLPDERAIRRLGRAYMRGPEARSFQPVSGSGMDLDSAIRADFAGGRVVTVDGWLVSETEARLAAALCVA